ncbi:sugar phosphate isomerase/epimerase family protein [Sodalis sp. C49]|uniref:sugar phosphate isomerase/epimerase family protein n=1 Tax=unclassified Sodalis (in: enterobacteria) TaxID=2636512 RepID=UPI0039659D9D
MRKSIATLSMAGSLPEKLEAIARAGFDAVELFDDDLQRFPGTARDVKRLLDALDLEAVLLQPLRNADGAPAAGRAGVLAEAGRMFDAMAELGCRQLLVCSSVDQDALADEEAQNGDLLRLAELAQRYGCAICYEALAWGRHVHHYRQAWERVSTVAMPNLGLALDSFHILALADNLDGLAHIPAEKIFYVQMADAAPRPRPSQPVDAWSRHHRCFPGQGILDVAGFARQVAAAGYRGIWSLEIFSDRYQRETPQRIAAEGFASLAWLEREITARRP